MGSRVTHVRILGFSKRSKFARHHRCAGKPHGKKTAWFWASRGFTPALNKRRLQTWPRWQAINAAMGQNISQLPHPKAPMQFPFWVGFLGILVSYPKKVLRNLVSYPKKVLHRSLWASHSSAPALTLALFLFVKTTCRCQARRPAAPVCHMYIHK